MDNKEITYEDIISFPALYIAGEQCWEGVTWKESIQKFAVNLPFWAADMHMRLESGKYKPEKLTEFDIMERGKKRHIQAVKPWDRMVQKSLTNNALKPIIEPLLIDDNAASRNGMGTDYALKRLRQHLANHYRNYGNEGGILVMDLHDFFHSIDHDKLMDMYRQVISDEKIVHLIQLFIDQFKDGGLGLGSEVSQISAIFYANNIDHYIKNELGINGYARYMDDSYVISHDIELLKELRDRIEKMYANLGITMNKKKTQIVRFSKGSFTYLQKRIHFDANGKIVMKPVDKAFRSRRRKLKKQYKKYKNGEIPISNIQEAYCSWRGQILKYDCYQQVRNMDKFFFKLFGVSYDGATIEDIEFIKELSAVRKRFQENKEIDINRLKTRYRKWDNQTKNDASKHMVYKKVKHKYNKLLREIQRSK